MRCESIINEENYMLVDSHGLAQSLKTCIPSAFVSMTIEDYVVL